MHGHQAVNFFPAKLKKLDRNKFKNLHHSFKDQEGSEIIMTPNMIMAGEAGYT